MCTASFVLPDFFKDFLIQTDASDVGIGAVLSQVHNGEEHPVVYLSRKLNDHEKKYAVIEKECVTVLEDIPVKVLPSSHKRKSPSIPRGEIHT